MQLPFTRIAILGLGLIGSSLTRAIADKLPDVHISAYDPIQASLDYATQQGFIHSAYPTSALAVHNADLVVLASPLSSFPALAAEIVSALKPGTVITDTGSVKCPAISAITLVLPKSIAYVPGHPVAGSERTGAGAGRADLFLGKTCVLTPAEADLMTEPVAHVKLLWEFAGAKIEFMPAELHDRIYAYVSHLPQLVAFAARSIITHLPLQDSEIYRRFTRLMKSDTALWADIFLANADYIIPALTDFSVFISRMADELAEESSGNESNSNLENVVELFAYIVASCLIASASTLQEQAGVHPARYAGTGFADMTAAARAHPEAILSAISSHPDEMKALLRTLLDSIHFMKHAIEKGDKSALINI